MSGTGEASRCLLRFGQQNLLDITEAVTSGPDVVNARLSGAAGLVGRLPISLSSSRARIRRTQGSPLGLGYVFVQCLSGLSIIPNVRPTFLRRGVVPIYISLQSGHLTTMTLKSTGMYDSKFG